MFKTKQLFAVALITSTAALAPLTADAWWGSGFPFGGWSPWNNGWGGGPWNNGWGGGPWGGYPGYGYGYPGYGYGYPAYGYGVPYYGYQPYYAPAAPAAAPEKK